MASWSAYHMTKDMLKSSNEDFKYAWNKLHRNERNAPAPPKNIIDLGNCLVFAFCLKPNASYSTHDCLKIVKQVI